MIYTCTLNPSVDYHLSADSIQLGALNKMKDEAKVPGGKGINVSRVLKRLTIESKALGFTGGFTGNFIKDYLRDESVIFDFIEVQGDTRINVKLHSDKETEINAQGPHISAEKVHELLRKINELNQGDILVLAGSIPGSLPTTIYNEMMKQVAEKDVKVVVDTTKQGLHDVLSQKPFLIKPNHHELAELFDVEINEVQDAIPYGKKLIDMGAENVIVSMSGMGALLFTKNNSYYANVPNGKVVNTVGAGDSLVAGFIASYVKNRDLPKAFQYGVAAGSATAFSNGFCTMKKIQALMKDIQVKELIEEVTT